jgi:hypothetical protein
MRKLLAGAGIGLAAALIALATGRLSFVETVELKTYDIRVARPSVPISPAATSSS